MGDCQYLLSASNASAWPSFSVEAQNARYRNTVNTVTNKVSINFDGRSKNVTYEIWMSLAGSRISTSIKIAKNKIPSTLNVNEINNAGSRLKIIKNTTEDDIIFFLNKI